MKRRRDRRREIAWWVLSAVIVISMVCSLAMLVRPAPEPQPTPQVPTATPTSPPAAAAPTVGASDFSFAVAGDSRDGDVVFKRILDAVAGERPAFLLHTGDLVGRGSEKAFQAFRALVADFPLPFYPVPGNHDGSLLGDLADYLRYSGAPAAHYSFDYGRAHFALADSHRGSLSTEEMAWLDADLAATAQPLKIVVLHHPPFDPNGSSHIMAGGNEAFMQLMVKRGVRYVFAGHIHEFAEGRRDGVTYIITGGAGAPLAGDEERGGYYHYLRAQVHGTDLTYEVVRVSPEASLAVPPAAVLPVGL